MAHHCGSLKFQFRNFLFSVGDFDGLHHSRNWQFRFGVAKRSMFLALLGADPTSDRGFLFGWPDLSQNEPSFARVSFARMAHFFNLRDSYWPVLTNPSENGAIIKNKEFIFQKADVCAF